MRIAKPLTDEGTFFTPAVKSSSCLMLRTEWATLYPQLIKRLETTKELRLKQQKQKRISERCFTLHEMILSWALEQHQPQDILPKVLDVAFSEPFRSFVFDDLDTEPTFITDKDELAGIMERFTEEWNEARNEFLLSLIPKFTSKGRAGESTKGKGAATPISVLELATTFFQCPSGRKNCSSGQDALSYPRILAHECQRTLATRKNRRDTDPEGLHILSTGLYSRPWLSTCKGTTFDQEASDIARMIVQECGEDPNEVTAERMDDIGCRLECLRCSGTRRGQERCIVKWRMAVSFFLTLPLG